MHERMSQGKGVKGLKEKKKVPGWSIEEMKKIQILLLWKRFKPERNGPMLKEWKRKSWTSTRPKKAKERPSEVEVLP